MAADATRPGNLTGIAGAIATITAVGIGLSLGIPLLAVVMEQRGIPGTLIGLNSAMAGIASILIAPLVARVLSRVSAAPLAFASVVVAAATFPGFWLIDDIAWWFPLRILFHGAVTSAFIVSEYWIVALAPERRRGLVMGVYSTLLSLGFAAGPILLGLLGSEGPWPFFIGAAIMASASLPVLLAWNRTPQRHEAVAPRFMRTLFAVPTATLAGFVFGFVESGEFAFLPIYGLRSGMQEAAAAALVTAIALGGIVFLVPIGMLADRVDRHVILAFCAAAGAAGIALLPLAIGAPLSAYALLFVYGGITGSIYTVGLVHLGARMAPGELASANAVFVFMYSLGMLTGPASLGVAIDLWNPTGVPALLTLMLAAYAAFVIVRRLRIPDRRPEVGAEP